MAWPRGRGGPKRRPAERERDAGRAAERRCQRVPEWRILEIINEERYTSALDAARREGMPKREAAAFAERSKISMKTLIADRRWLEGRLAAEHETEAAGGIKIQLARTWQLLESFQAMERTAHEELAKSREPVVAEISGERRSKRVQAQRSADPRWAVVIEQLLWKQFVVMQEIFRLETLLGLDASAQIAALEHGDAEPLALHEVGALFSAHSRAIGLKPADALARMKAVAGYMEQRGAGSPTGPGDEAPRLTLLVRGVEVDDEVPS